ncbi:hypothetical protein SADUNF_Sadunf01G0103300 [Salix dunnii]|uniref:Uncharacterized protein n=1 Tax=Salix dunnii TaxID=1413687 RepID=A0A835NBB5_9ROSI|nr:hypothetical protein SADUNF_Sadunf01G0103300 [Salix dunnii]
MRHWAPYAIIHLECSHDQFSSSLPSRIFENLAYPCQNILAGEIPQGYQFETFTSASFEGSIGLCGPSLTKTCSHALPPMEPNADHENSTWGLDLVVEVEWADTVAINI